MHEALIMTKIVRKFRPACKSTFSLSLWAKYITEIFVSYAEIYGSP